MLISSEGQFKRVGAGKLGLIWIKGIPCYAGGRLISPYNVVLWWPGNWMLAVYSIYRLCVGRNESKS